MFVEIAKIDRVIVSLDNWTTDQQTALIFVENRASRVMCSAFGSHPAPQIDIVVGHDKDIGASVTTSSYVSEGPIVTTPSVTGRQGLRRIYYTTVRSRQSFRATSDEDGQVIKCIASVVGSTPVVTSARIVVHCTY